MNKLIVIIATMILSCGDAAAEWIQFGENDRSVGYVDSEIRKSGEIVTLWMLSNYKTQQVSERSGRQYQSEKSQREIDCRNERSRTLFFSWHQREMGNGLVVYTGTKATNWEPTSAPGSIASALWKFACQRK